jgi:hypothetical protein
MSTPLDDLNAERISILHRLVDELAIERGLKPSEGLAATTRHELIYRAELAYEAWSQRIQDGDIPTPSTPLEYLLAELCAVDDIIRKTEAAK